MSKTTNITALIALLAKNQVQAQKQIDEAIVDIQKNPFHALTWGDKMTRAAAQLQIIATMLPYLHKLPSKDIDAKEVVEHWVSQLTREIMVEMQNTSLSSSPMRNVMAAEKRAAIVQLIEELRWAEFIV